ncbi:MAG: C10 family peptidase [Alistipes sp.]|nr:C10 family peptidase [Alistipes sp.]
MAVAIAQLMAVYKYPNNYYYNTATFNWDDMTNQPPSAVGEEQISILMYLLGNVDNLDMTYRTVSNGGSGSNSNTIPRTLRNFGYLDGFRRVDYDTDSVMMELASSYPVLLRGETASEKGHMWLAHGSMKITITPVYPDTYPGIVQQQPVINDYILCNWGWYGDDDGYYLSGMFYTDYGPRYPDENITRLNFQNNIKAYINIRKPN